MGKKEAEECGEEVTKKAYRKKLANAVTSGALDAASSKAEFLQGLCDSLHFNPQLAAQIHAGTVQECTALHSTVIFLHSTLKCSTVRVEFLQGLCDSLHFNPQLAAQIHTGAPHYSSVLCSTVQYCTVQYSTAQHSTAQHCSTVQHPTGKCSTVQAHTVWHSNVAQYLVLSSPADIYRQKLQQCLEDGALSDEDVAALLRLRVLLCVPKSVEEKAHADICGSIFTKVHNSTVQYSTVQYTTEQYSTVQYSTVQSSAGEGARRHLRVHLHQGTLQCRTVYCSGAQWSKVQYSAAQCSAAQCTSTAKTLPCRRNADDTVRTALSTFYLCVLYCTIRYFCRWWTTRSVRAWMGTMGTRGQRCRRRSRACACPCRLPWTSHPRRYV